MASVVSGDDGAESKGAVDLKSISVPETGSRQKDPAKVSLFAKLTFQPSSYTYYTVKVTLTDGKTFAVDRRYSEFYILHRLLRRKFAMVKTLRFPTKRLFSNMAKKTVEERRGLFVEYLQHLINLHPRPFDFNRFLSLADHVPSAMYKGGDGSTKKYGMNDFELMRVLGKGSFGKVFLVRLLATKQVYAMKVLKKSEVIRRKQIEHTKTERRIMGTTDHPFIVTLRYAFQSEDKLYFVTDYCRGGELFFHLKRMKVFNEDMVRFYSAEIFCALSHLHSHKIVYRDLKPENVLLDHEGHVRITDFGLSRDDMEDGEHGAMTFCGTPEYLSPEMIYHRKTQEGYGNSVDWWSLGTLMYEMFTGWPPFYDKNIRTMMQKILHASLVFPDKFDISEKAKSMMEGLLSRKLEERLGANNDHQKIMEHPFYEKMDWDALKRREIKPPFLPKVKGETDIGNFDKGFTKMPARLTPEAADNHLQKFEDFTFSESSKMKDAMDEEDAIIDIMTKKDEQEDVIIEKQRECYDKEDERKKKETLEALKEINKPQA
jgi:serine/threonine protein kinase